MSTPNSLRTDQAESNSPKSDSKLVYKIAPVTWIQHQDAIYTNYLVENLTLDQILERLKTQGFTPSKRQLTLQLSKWGYFKKKSYLRRNKPSSYAYVHTGSIGVSSAYEGCKLNLPKRRIMTPTTSTEASSSAETVITTRTPELSKSDAGLTPDRKLRNDGGLNYDKATQDPDTPVEIGVTKTSSSVATPSFNIAGAECLSSEIHTTSAQKYKEDYAPGCVLITSNGASCEQMQSSFVFENSASNATAAKKPNIQTFSATKSHSIAKTIELSSKTDAKNHHITQISGSASSRARSTKDERDRKIRKENGPQIFQSGLRNGVVASMNVSSKFRAPTSSAAASRTSSRPRNPVYNPTLARSITSSWSSDLNSFRRLGQRVKHMLPVIGSELPLLSPGSSYQPSLRSTSRITALRKSSMMRMSIDDSRPSQSNESCRSGRGNFAIIEDEIFDFSTGSSMSMDLTQNKDHRGWRKIDKFPRRPLTKSNKLNLGFLTGR